MKYAILIAFLSPLTAAAQFSKGDKFIGGTVSLHMQQAPESPNGSYASKYTDFSIQPELGFFLSEKFALGGHLGYSIREEEVIIDPSLISDYVSHSFSVGLLIRRYFQIADKFFLSLDGNPYYAKTENDYPNSETESYSIGMVVKPVFIFFPSKKWGIEAGIGNISYTHTRNTTLEQDVNNFNLNYGSLSFGLAYFLRREAE